MAASTMDLVTVEEKANSVYEAVLIVAKRARAITAERKAREVLEESLESSEETFNYDDEPEIKTTGEAKAIVVAMDEFFEDKLEVNYRKEEK